MAANPTKAQYDALHKAYAFFNKRLFNGTLPDCILVLDARSPKTLGHHSQDRYGRLDGSAVNDQIALSPRAFRGRPLPETLSTLVHEMVHLKQHFFGKPSRNRYHNAEWASMMEEVGLTPSNTGAKGGKRTGQRMSHFIALGGPFDGAARSLIATGFDIPFADIWADKKRKTGDRAKYTCQHCGTNAWAKPDICMNCLNVAVDEGVRGRHDIPGAAVGLAMTNCQMLACGEGEPV